MIAYLTGSVREVRETSAVVLAGGVGYEVYCPATSLGKLSVNGTAELHTRLIVREDAWTLYGFLDTDSARLFDLLTSVTGIGPKLALSLLSALAPQVLAGGILNGDSALLSSVSGVGKKTAERLVLELQHKVPQHLAVGAGGGAKLAVTSSAGQDAIEALQALGFREAQVRGAVSEVLAGNSELTTDQIIRKSLGKLR